jgi:hypothetical protein
MNVNGVKIQATARKWKNGRKLLFSVVEAAFQVIVGTATAGFGGTKSAISTAFRTIESLELENEPGRLAWLLVGGALARSLETTLMEIQYDSPPSRPIIKDIIRRLADRIGNAEYLLESTFFNNPAEVPILADFAKDAADILRPILGEKTTLDIRRLISRHFIPSLHRTWMISPSLFQPLITALHSPFSETIEILRNKEAHLLKLIDDFEIEPLIGQEDESSPVTLAQIFVSLRAITYFIRPDVTDSNLQDSKSFYRRPILPTAGDQPDAADDEFPIGASIRGSFLLTRAASNIEDSITYLSMWIKERERVDQIKIVAGGPGIGKTSTLRALAAHLAKGSFAMPIIVPLKDMEASGPLRDRIEKFLQRTEKLFAGWSLFDKIQLLTSTSPLVLIFDGLDEIAAPGQASEEATREFAFEVRQLLTDVNPRTGKPIALAIIAGRTSAAEHALQVLKLRPNCNVELLPYALTKEEEARYGIGWNSSIADQRPAWWEKWHRLVPDTPAHFPDVLAHESLFDVSREPLLLYFLALARAWEKGDPKADLNRGAIYERILRLFHHRECIKGRPGFATAFSNYDDYEVILQSLALSAWYTGTSRVGDIKTSEKLLGIWNPDLLDKFNAVIGGRNKAFGASLTFHLRAKEASSTFEFLHKTFCEFLVARRLAYHTKELCDDYFLEGRRKQTNREDALIEWLTAWGVRALDEYVFRFVREETHWKAKRYFPNLMKYKGALETAFDQVLTDGVPVSILFSNDSRVIKTAQSGSEASEQARNAEETMFARCTLSQGRRVI